MKFFLIALLETLLGALLLSGSAVAEEEPAKRSPMEIKYYVQGNYLVNAGNPPSGENEGRAFDRTSNFLSLDMAQSLAAREATPGALGFRVKLNAGPEYRHERSHADFFKGGASREQSTYGIGVMSPW